MQRGKKLNLTGRSFYCLTVVRRATKAEKPASRHSYWLVRCDCGVEKVVAGFKLVQGRVRTCRTNGHTWSSLLASLRRAAGDHPNSSTSEYRSWAHMKARCYRSNHDRFLHYGGRGIVVCDRWKDSFENFLTDMGLKPTSKHSVERIDVNGDYEPSNCRWATDAEQRRNMRRSVYVEVGGQRQLLLDYCAEHGLDRGRVYRRLKLGWTLERASNFSSVEQPGSSLGS